MSGSWNKENKQKFKRALIDHITDSDTIVIDGTYHNKPVIHLFNTVTNNNVITSQSGEFISGWALSEDQKKHITTTGDL